MVPGAWSAAWACSCRYAETESLTSIVGRTSPDVWGRCTPLRVRGALQCLVGADVGRPGARLFEAPSGSPILKVGRGSPAGTPVDHAGVGWIHPEPPSSVG